MIYLKEIRTEKGLSVDELSEKSNLTKPQLWSYESGRREPPLDALIALADALDVSLDMLVRGKEKDRLVRRSMDSIFNEYMSLSQEELEYFQSMLQAVLAEKRFQAHLRQGGKETP